MTIENTPDIEKTLMRYELFHNIFTNYIDSYIHQFWQLLEFFVHSWKMQPNNIAECMKAEETIQGPCEWLDMLIF